MKVEQACRFRTQEGYGITGKSAGFDQNQAKVFAEVFNDSMNPIFPKLGTSVLTCAVRGSYAFYARNTYRTHSSREAIFTHSYIMPLEAYAEAMRRMPQKLLAVPMSELMTSQACSPDMEAVEFPSEKWEQLQLDALFEKYNLTPARYTRLLMGAYEAMTSNRSLRLYTGRTIESTEEMVRELVYCILDGLLPFMKGQVTFSSGADTRMNFSVVHAGGRAAQSDDLIFGVEDDRVTNIRPRDEMSSAFFSALGQADHAARRELLERVENWLREATNVDDGISVLLICAAYSCCSEQDMSHETQLSLFRTFSRAAGKAIPLKIANYLLTGLVQNMIAANRVSVPALSLIAEWYLGSSSEDFRNAANRAFDWASEEICAALVNAAIQLPPGENAYALVTALMSHLPADSEELTEEIRTELLAWIIRENVKPLSGFCGKALSASTPAVLKALACDILADVENAKMNILQTEVLLWIVRKAAKDPDAIRFSPREQQQLDSHIEAFARVDMVPVIAYILNVRLRDYGTVKSQVDFLMELCSEHPVVSQALKETMTLGKDAQQYAQLWEAFQTRAVFAEGVSGEEIPYLLRQHNTFRNPAGPFERKAASLWAGYVGGRMVAAGDRGTLHEILQKRNDAAESFLDQASKLEMSSQMRAGVKKYIIKQFWDQMTFEQICACSGDVKLYHELKEVEPEARFKLDLWGACGRMIARGDDAGEVVELITRTLMPILDREKLQDLLPGFAERMAHKHRVVVWDLLLLHAWTTGDAYDLDKLCDRIDRLQQYIDRLQLTRMQSSAAGSVLLMNAAVRKAVIKKLDSGLYESPRIAQMLVTELKTSRYGQSKPFGAQRSPEKPVQRAVAPKQEPPVEAEPRGRQATQPKEPQTKPTQPRSGYTPPFGQQRKEPENPKGFLSGLFGKGKK